VSGTMTTNNLALPELPAGVMPFESWEKLRGESAGAFAAFCAYRDYGPERNVRRAAAASFTKEEQGEAAFRGRLERRYKTWRTWAAEYKWRDRAADYDRYLDGLKQAEARKTIEAQGEVHRMITGKMLQVVSKKLDMMSPEELAQGTVTEWVQTAIKTEREIAGLLAPKDGGEVNGKSGTITFQKEFEGL